MIPAVVPCTDRALWDEYVDRFQGHPQQLWGWGETKAMHGWSVDRVLLNDGDNIIGCAQLLIRRLPFPFRALVYIPRGPMCSPDHAEAVLGRLAEHAAVRHRGVALSIEPDWDEDSAFAAPVAAAGFRSSTNTVLIPRTLILDLTLSDDELMAGMSKSTRANIRKAMRSDVEFRKVKNDAELEQVLAIYHETAERAGFGIHGHAGRRLLAVRLQRAAQRRHFRLQEAVCQARKHAPGHLGKTAVTLLPGLCQSDAFGAPRAPDCAAAPEECRRQDPSYRPVVTAKASAVSVLPATRCTLTGASAAARKALAPRDR